MNVVYTFDDGYSAITAVSILSLLKNNQKASDLQLFIVDCGICNENKKLIKSIAFAFNRTITFVQALDLKKRIPMDLNVLYWSTVCYVRLFLAEMFPGMDRIMHIDGDTIIRGSLEDIYSINMEGRYCAACYDCVAASKRKLGLAVERPYLNNGFIVFNFDEIRKDHIEDQFVNYIIEHKGNLPHLDQDVLSAVIGEKTTIIHPKYNLMSITAAYGSDSTVFFDKKDLYYSKLELNEAVDDPIMIHFVGNRFMSRPWSQPCYHPYNREWLQYYEEGKAINCNLTINFSSKRSMIRRLAGYFWNIGYKFTVIRKIELKIDQNYYRKKGKT